MMPLLLKYRTGGGLPPSLCHWKMQTVGDISFFESNETFLSVVLQVNVAELSFLYAHVSRQSVTGLAVIISKGTAVVETSSGQSV
jgi:hypothetical protein